MNNLRLLTGLLAAVLSGGGVCAYGQRVITLEEVYDSAERNSAQLRPYFTADEVAAREVAEARSAMLPDINATLSVSYIGDGFTTKRDFSDYERAPIPHFGNGLSLSVNQPVYTGGAITAGVDMAREKSAASRLATELKRDNLRLQLTGFYLDLYKYSNLRAVVEQNRAQARKVLDEMNARYEQGTALRNDITRYELLVSNLDLQLIKIANTLEILNRNLVTMAGLPEGTIVVPDTTILNRSVPVSSESGWATDARSLSPVIGLARQEVSISRTAEKLVGSDRLPKVGLQAGWTIDGPILVEVPPIDRNLSYWYVGVGVSYNISSLFKTNKSVARSRVATLRAEQQLEAARENIDIALHADYVRYMEAYEEVRTQEKSVELARSNYSTVATRYAEDMALITDMLDAANSQLDSEKRLVNARIDVIYYYYKLLFTSGKI
ncbi:MAG: TolC family protein [Duncaniella sp.]|nr:TolC family protein [Duncaniella sp.]